MKYLTVLVGFFACVNLTGQIVAVNSDGQNDYFIKYFFMKGFENKVVILDTTAFFSHSEYFSKGSNLKIRVCLTCKITKVENGTISKIDTVNGIPVYYILTDSLKKKVKLHTLNTATGKTIKQNFDNVPAHINLSIYPGLKSLHGRTYGKEVIDSLGISIYAEGRGNPSFIDWPGYKIIHTTITLTDSTKTVTRYEKEFDRNYFSRDESKEWYSKTRFNDHLYIDVIVIDKYGIKHKTGAFRTF